MDSKFGLISGGIGGLVIAGLFPILYRVDAAVGTPVSLAGLAMAATLFAAYYWAGRRTGRVPLQRIAILTAVVVAATSLMPLFGVVESDSRIYGLAGFFFVLGVMGMILGITDHVLLSRIMKGSSERG